MSHFKTAKPVLGLRRRQSFVPRYNRDRNKLFEFLYKIKYTTRRRPDRIIHIDGQSDHDLFRLLLNGKFGKPGGIISIVLPHIQRKSERNLFGGVGNGKAHPLFPVIDRENLHNTRSSFRSRSRSISFFSPSDSSLGTINVASGV